MSAESDHIGIVELKRQFAEQRIGRREFIRYACLLGLSATAAYRLVGLPAPAQAQPALPRGGTLRIGMRCFEIATPHRWQNIIRSNSGRQVLDYLVTTGADNITRPSLCEKWEASADLKSWTLHLRKDVTWHDGRQFTADDVIWNLKRVLDPKTGSSVLGQMKSFLIEEVETGEKDEKGNPKKSSQLWDAQAIAKKDDFTIVINGKTPQVALPEVLFHYQMAILDPAGGGEFKPGSNGTGAFTLVENEVGRRQVFKARKSYWGGGPHLDTLEFVDLGDDPAASLSAMASKQVDGLYRGGVTMLETMKNLPGLTLYEVDTADTAVARMQPVKPFDDKRVRQAIRFALDVRQVAMVSLRSAGTPGEHHHVAPVHPDYAKLPFVERDVAKAKQLLADAGYPNGIDIEIACHGQFDWQPSAVQIMVEQWKEAGIRAKINLVQTDYYWDNWTKFPFGFTTWAHRPLGVMTLSLAYRSGVAWNEAKYANPEFDALLNEAEAILDPDKRRAVLAKLEAIMLDDGPIALPAWGKVFTFMDKRVQGFKMHPTGYIFGHELAIAT
jgi:peptide/nickel transport system substrate-binding protein